MPCCWWFSEKKKKLRKFKENTEKIEEKIDFFYRKQLFVNSYFRTSPDPKSSVSSLIINSNWSFFSLDFKGFSTWKSNFLSTFSSFFGLSSFKLTDFSEGVFKRTSFLSWNSSFLFRNCDRFKILRKFSVLSLLMNFSIIRSIFL